MSIDIVFLIVLIAAILKGLRNGLLLGVFSLVGWIIGLAAALKLSASVANYLRAEAHWDSRWLPFLSFIAVFIGVAMLVRWGAMLVQKGIELAMLGWINKIGGVLLYAVIYTLLFSVFLFYADKMNLVSETTEKASRSYAFVQPWGPVVIDWIGKFLPMFKDVFHDLENFFEDVGRRVDKAVTR